QRHSNYLLHSSNGSSELSPQSLSTSHFQLWGMQRPLRHLNCPGRQSFSPSHCHDSGMQRLFAHCQWWFSHWWVSTRSSSEPSGQSWLLLHRKCGLVQFPSLH
uniref:Uncharacterized protein n=1 Tax=Takifugu rubripes TaxID=31033 RepID=A0A3B5KBV5_TAKRU